MLPVQHKEKKKKSPTFFGKANKSRNETKLPLGVFQKKKKLPLTIHAFHQTKFSVRLGKYHKGRQHYWTNLGVKYIHRTHLFSPLASINMNSYRSHFPQQRRFLCEEKKRWIGYTKEANVEGKRFGSRSKEKLLAHK